MTDAIKDLLTLTLPIAIAGWWYARTTGLEKVRTELLQRQAELGASMNSLYGVQIEDLERRLKACEQRWQKWAGGPVGGKQ